MILNRLATPQAVVSDQPKVDEDESLVPNSDVEELENEGVNKSNRSAIRAAQRIKEGVSQVIIEDILVG